MSLLDQLREAQAEPARHRTSPFAGPSILTLEQLRAMERVLLREMPRYGRPEVEPLALWSPPTSVAEPAGPVAIDLTDETPVRDAEPLPIWTAPAPTAAAPPTAAPVGDAPPARREPDPCPSCGEAVAIGRIDLTANASWFSCRRCGLRWGGAIENAS